MQLVIGLVRRFPIIVLIVVVGVVGVVFREHLSGAVADLRVGDCFEEPAQMATGELTEVKDVQRRPCSDPHDGEVVAVFKHPADRSAAYPSQEVMIDFVAEQCVPAFDAYAGLAFEEALEFELAWFYPTSSGWAGGDREFTCYAYSADGTKRTGSIRAVVPANP